MKKTPLVFVLDRVSGELTPEVRPESAWVVRGEGEATIKYDGTAARWHDGRLWKRYDRKLKKAAQRRRDQGGDLGPLTDDLFKEPPPGFEPCEATPDPVTHHWPGWVPIAATDPADRWYLEALGGTEASILEEGATYEVVGPAYSLNPYGLVRHELWKHGKDAAAVPDRSFEGLKAWLAERQVEGLVFHHPDGRMAKIRRKDYGLFWVQDDPRDRRRFRPR